MLDKARVNPESADMYWLGSGATISASEDEYKLKTEPYLPLYERVKAAITREEEDSHLYGFDTSGEIKAKQDFLSRLYPAWSLSAIWQMVHEIDKTYEFPTNLSANELIDTLVATIINRRGY